MILFNSPYNYLLNWSFICALIPWLYSYFNEQRRERSMTVEEVFTYFINIYFLKTYLIIIGTYKFMGSCYSTTNY